LMKLLKKLISKWNLFMTIKTC